MRELQKKIVAGEDLRGNLIELKLQLKLEKNREAYKKLCQGNYDVLMKCLVHEDAKVRKNVAAILGILGVHEAVDVLMDAYLEEDKLFVRSEYVTALANLDCEEYLDDFRTRRAELEAYDAPENEKKHVQEELHAISELLLRKEGMKKHRFTGTTRANEVILTTLPAFRDSLAESLPGQKKLLKAGVKMVISDLRDLEQNRLWQEILFVVNKGKTVGNSPKEVAQGLRESDLLEILQENHAEDTPFYFRIGVSGGMPMEERGGFARQAAAQIEQAFEHKLVNSTSHYEVEIRLIQGKDGMMPVLKLFTLADHRFDYRRYHVAASMKPFVAAGILSLAAPYLREYAQVLDPFCGVGTMLIERRFQSPVRNMYGIDTFGEAIDKARMNTKIAGFQANYINRDYFDFGHEYAFDEIITDMPAGNLSKADLDEIYGRFFRKSLEHLTENGRVFLYSKEMGLVKKYLRLTDAYRLLQEYCISEKSGAYLFILERR